MLILPTAIMALMNAFAPLLDPRVFEYAKVLVIGAILAPRKRMVSSTLRVMGLADEAQYQNYYRVLNRARWSSVQVSKVLLLLIVAALVPRGAPVVLVIDETLERRWGRKIKALSVFRDPVQSSKSHVIKTPALRWVNMAIVVQVPWSSRPWALPFLTVLAPSEKTNQKHGKRHKTSPKWARQMICQARRWLPNYALTVVTDGGLVAIETGHRCMQFRNPVSYVARLRMDARLYDAPTPKPKSQPGPQACIGKRQFSPKQHIENPDTLWDQHEVDWYGGEHRTIETTTGASLWYDHSQKPLSIRWIIVRDPKDQMRPAAFFGTDPAAFPAQSYPPRMPLSPFWVLACCIMRHNHEVTFEEVREHLGFETQRQWNDLAIARTSPAILGLFSFVVLLAYHLLGENTLPVRQAAWYSKTQASFSDAIAFVRRYLWQRVRFSPYVHKVHTLEVPLAALQDLIDCLAYAA